MDTNATVLVGREADGVRLIRDLLQKSEVFRITKLCEGKKHIDFRMPVMVVNNSLNTTTMPFHKRIAAFQKVLIVLLVLRNDDLWYFVHCVGVRFQHTSVDCTVKYFIAPLIVFT